MYVCMRFFFFRHHAVNLWVHLVYRLYRFYTGVEGNFNNLFEYVAAIYGFPLC